MEKVTASNFSLGLEFSFPRAMSLLEANLPDFTRRFAEAFELDPTAVTLRHSDILFNYDLNASFYSGNAILLLNAKSFSLNFTGGYTIAHVDLIQSELLKFREIMGHYEDALGTFVALGTCTFASDSAAEAFFRRYEPEGERRDATREDFDLKGGLCTYFKARPERGYTRVGFEPALGMPKDAFVVIRSPMKLSEVSQESLIEVSVILTEIAENYGIEVEIPEERR